MKAVVFCEHGGIDKLELVDVPSPSPGRGEVLIQVKAVALNRLDVWMREGLGVEIPMPHISGSDVCGIVAEIGEGCERVGNSADRLNVGDRVIVSPGQSCGVCDRCLAGRDSECPRFTILGFQSQGGYAEFLVTRACNIFPVPRILSYEEWAGLPLVFLTAYHMLFSRAQLGVGESVLVHGCGSGVGSAAIQLAKLAGARVITTSSSDHKLRRAQAELGADAVINYSKERVADSVRDWTDGHGVDLVFDHIGPSVWEESLASLARGGRLVSCGATSGPRVSFDLRPFYSRQISLLGSYMGSRAELARVLQLAVERKIRPVIDQVLRLADAAKAQERMLGRENFGKIVLTTDSCSSA